MPDYWGLLGKAADDNELIEAAIERIFQTHNFFGNVSLWGMIAKALDDNQTIDEAIAVAITEHNANEDAHLGVGESLQSHKASEIIDHEALSVVTDKIQNYGIDQSKISFTKLHFFDFFGSLDSWTLDGDVANITSKLGMLNLHLPGTVADEMWAQMESFGYDINCATKHPVFQCLAKISGGVAAISFGIGFWQTGKYIMFSNASGCSIQYIDDSYNEFEVEIADIDMTEWHRYRIECSGTTVIKFYIDDVLVYTTATITLTTLDEGINFYAHQTSTGQDPADLWVSWCQFYQDI